MFAARHDKWCITLCQINKIDDNSDDVHTIFLKEYEHCYVKIENRSSCLKKHVMANSPETGAG